METFYVYVLVNCNYLFDGHIDRYIHLSIQSVPRLLERLFKDRQRAVS